MASISDESEIKATHMTYKGMICLYHKLFEKLGWVVLAQSQGDTSKVSEYSRHIKKLASEIQNALTAQDDSKITEQDRIRDLRIMQQNLNVLETHVSKDFGIAMTGGKKRTSKKHSKKSLKKSSKKRW